MIMCVLLCYPVSIHIHYQQGVLFLVFIAFTASFVILTDGYFRFLQNIIKVSILL